MASHFLSLAAFVQMLLIACCDAQNVVQTATGPVKGSAAPLPSGKRIFTFKNIPYAQPPVGQLRFKAPEEVTPWTEVLDCSYRGEDIFCPQIPQYPSLKTKAEAIGKEDCLFLDIYTTQLPNEGSSGGRLWPVVVYFHGGLFEFGSKDQYGPEYFLSASDAVLVIVNYRLGILGFLSTGDKILPGNLGLLDQRIALKWIQSSIGNFGGNMSEVTIAGHDAGGASVGLHILSPSSHAYFSAAISGSGTALDPWALTSDPRSNSLRVAKELGCPVSSSQNLANCLRGKPLEEIMETERKLFNVTFRPTVDKSSEDPFISDLPSRLYAQGRYHKVPYLAGVTTNEASIEFYAKFSEARKLENLDKIIRYLLEPYLKGTDNIDSVVKAAKYHYLRGLDIPDFLAIAPPVIEMMTDFLYVTGLEQTMKNHSSPSSPCYMYVFGMTSGLTSIGDIFGPAEYNGLYRGISHMDDVMYIFNTSFGSWMKQSAKNNILITTKETMNQVWQSFASKRIPTTRNLAWQNYNVRGGLNYMELSFGGSVKSLQNYRQDASDFWTLLVPDLQGVSNTTGGISPLTSKQNSATWGVAGLAILLAVLCVALAATVVVTRKRLMKRSSVPISISREKDIHGDRV